jgi:surface antigen
LVIAELFRVRGAISRPKPAKDTGRLPYHGTARTSAPLAWLVSTPIAAGLIAMLLGGCSMQISSLLPGGVSDQGPTVIRAQNPDPQTTGSIPLHMTSATDMPLGMSVTDWPLAQAALKEALSRTDDGPSVPWENPASGARGTVTPIAAAFAKEGFSCRNFIVSHVKDAVETWSEGTACRMHQGAWEVKSVKPLKKT